MMSPSIAARTSLIHWKKHCCNMFGSSLAMTLAMVSWRGIPLGSSIKRCSHCSFAWPKSSMSSHPRAPESTALTVIRVVLQRLARASENTRRVIQQRPCSWHEQSSYWGSCPQSRQYAQLCDAAQEWSARWNARKTVFEAISQPLCTNQSRSHLIIKSNDI